MFSDNKMFEYYVLLTVGHKYFKRNEQDLWVLTDKIDSAYQFESPETALKFIHKIAFEKNLDVKNLKIIVKETRWELFTLSHEDVPNWRK
jgi:hypothetical protein